MTIHNDNLLNKNKVTYKLNKINATIHIYTCSDTYSSISFLIWVIVYQTIGYTLTPFMLPLCSNTVIDSSNLK